MNDKEIAKIVYNALREADYEHYAESDGEERLFEVTKESRRTPSQEYNTEVIIVKDADTTYELIIKRVD